MKSIGKLSSIIAFMLFMAIFQASRASSAGLSRASSSSILPFSISLLDTSNGFPVLKELSKGGFFNSTNARIQYLTGTINSGSGNDDITLTSSLVTSGGRDYASFSLLGNNLSQQYRISWQLDKNSDLTEDSMIRMLQLAIKSRTDDVNSVIFETITESQGMIAMNASYAFQGGDSLPGYSVTMSVGPSSTQRFWRTLGELSLLESGGLINYFVNRDANMVDWKYQPTREGMRRKITDGWYFDTNNFRTNTIYHIYSGSLYYQTGRSNGYGPMGSFIWAVAGSTFWEYVGEYREQVSINDQIFTPAGGIIVGESLRQMGLYVERSMRPGFFRGFICFILDPMRIINRQLDHWVTDDFTFTLSFINPAQAILNDAMMKHLR